jgi:[ribosomal protein S18]-alanine N-acetyltransferase
MGAESKRAGTHGTIRRFRAEDADAVRTIAKESPQAADWTAASYQDLAGASGTVALVSEEEGQVVGFLIGRQVGEEAEILNLAVAPAKQKRGEGGALVKAAMMEFRAHGVSRVFLEVRESNENGLAFYQKQGFFKTGRRPGYYRDPDEAAIMMELEVGD